MGAKSSSRNGARIVWIAVHTNEGENPPDVFPDKTAENLARYLDRSDVAASYHKIVDDDSTVHYLPDDRAAWALRAGNPRSLNICLSGFASWTRGRWMRHMGMLHRAAVHVREWCDRYRIPIRRLTYAEIRRGDEAGILAHDDYTKATGDGTHWDPGPNFPWDVFLDLVRTVGRRAGTGRRRRNNMGEKLPQADTPIDHIIGTDVVGGWAGRAILWLTPHTDLNRDLTKIYRVMACKYREGMNPDVVHLLNDPTGGEYKQWKSVKWELPAGTTAVVVNYVAPFGMTARVEYER